MRRGLSQLWQKPFVEKRVCRSGIDDGDYLIAIDGDFNAQETVFSIRKSMHIIAAKKHDGNERTERGIHMSSLMNIQ